MRKAFLSLALLAAGLAGCSSSTQSTTQPSTAAETPTIRLATYNVEHFNDAFRGFHMERAAATQPASSEAADLIAYVKRANNEKQWEIAQVLLDPDFSPDVLAVEEGPEQSDLDFFNKKWLDGMYQTVIVFPTNSTAHQTVCLLLKPGFKVLERKDQYYKEPDPGRNARGAALFARGPAFLLVQAPTGYTFWVGATHQKSKAGNSLDVTQWRNREARRTHEIVRELEHSHDVILLGDMNDSVGADDYERDPASGGDAMATLVGPSADGFVLATKPLADKGANSFHGYYNTKYRELIDHAVVTPEMAPRLKTVAVFRANPFTLVASDHYPVLVTIDASPSK